YYLGKQVVGVGAAVALGFVASRLNLHFLRRYAWWIGGGTLVLLALVLVPHIGVTVNGSRRWLGRGPIRVQVSEFAKVAMIFCLAHYLALNQTRLAEWRRGFLYPVGIVAAFTGLILREPDFGAAALTLAVGLILLFFAGARWRYLLLMGALAAGVFGVCLLHNANRMRRITDYLHVQANKAGGTYQLYQAEAAFAAGGIDGVGLGKGRQQDNFLPEAHNDCIFAVVGEELGLPFTLGVDAAFCAIFVAGLWHLRRAPNLFQFLLAGGAILLISLQAIINMGVVTGIFPTKGMSLPFISAGLSNLLLMGILIGLLVNTDRTWGRALLSSGGGSMREVLQ
ncbi:MAG: FtsW/RodA/SpoVE family cell cycle protein, partial [Opitutaceae bacterium]